MRVYEAQQAHEKAEKSRTQAKVTQLPACMHAAPAMLPYHHEDSHRPVELCLHACMQSVRLCNRACMIPAGSSMRVPSQLGCAHARRPCMRMPCERADGSVRSLGWQAEFDAEQEYIKTLSYLSAEEQQRQRARAGVSFMYQKPPGYDAAMARTAAPARTQSPNKLHAALSATFRASSRRIMHWNELRVKQDGCVTCRRARSQARKRPSSSRQRPGRGLRPRRQLPRSSSSRRAGGGGRTCPRTMWQTCWARSTRCRRTRSAHRWRLFRLWLESHVSLL